MINKIFKTLAIDVLVVLCLSFSAGITYAEENSEIAKTSTYSADLSGFKQALETSLSTRKSAIDEELSSNRNIDLPYFLNEIAQSEMQQLAGFKDVQPRRDAENDILVGQYIIFSYMEGLSMQATPYSDEAAFWESWEEGEKKRCAAVIEIYQMEEGEWTEIDQNIITKMTDVVGEFETDIYETDEAFVIQALVGTTVDGHVGNGSRVALKSFEMEKDMILNGVFNAATVNSIVEVIGQDAAVEKLQNAGVSVDKLDAVLQKVYSNDESQPTSTLNNN